MINNQGKEVCGSQQRYPAIDGLRTFAAFGIIAMHVMANGEYTQITGPYRKVIESWTMFVMLFMIISGFSMCCGYYKRFADGTISIVDFFKRRYQKVIPFFSLIVLLDLLVTHTPRALMESFANLTLCYALLPNCGNIEILSVGWTLGVVFFVLYSLPFLLFFTGDKEKSVVFFCMLLAVTLVL